MGTSPDSRENQKGGSKAANIVCIKNIYLSAGDTHCYTNVSKF